MSRLIQTAAAAVSDSFAAASDCALTASGSGLIIAINPLRRG